VSEVTSSQNANCSNNVTDGGIDYDSGPYNVTFPAGQTIASFGVLIYNDNTYKYSMVFNLTIIPDTLPDSVACGNPCEARVTIVDDEGEW